MSSSSFTGSSSESALDTHQEAHELQQQNGILHLSNGAIITLIVMVILTFISLLGLLGLYFLCPRRRGALISRSMPNSQQQQQQLHLSLSGISPMLKLGLEEEDIDKLPLLTYQELIAAQKSESTDFPFSSTSGCAVCLGEFREGDDTKIRFLPPCHHCFHPDCVDKWLRTSASCPLCRCNLLPPGHEDDIGAEELAATATLQEHYSSMLILANRPLNLPPNHLS